MKTLRRLLMLLAMIVISRTGQAAPAKPASQVPFSPPQTTPLSPSQPNQPLLGSVTPALSAIVGRIPLEFVPSKEQKRWNTFLLEDANNWLSNNICGQTLQVTTKLTSVGRIGDDFYVNFFVTNPDTLIKTNGLAIPTTIKMSGAFSRDHRNSFARMVFPKLCTFTGTIRKFSVSFNGESKNSPYIPTGVSIILKDCRFTENQPVETPNPPTIPKPPNSLTPITPLRKSL